MVDDFPKKSRMHMTGSVVYIFFNLSEYILRDTFIFNEVEYTISVEKRYTPPGKLYALVTVMYKDTFPEEDEFDEDVYESTDTVPRDGMVKYNFEIHDDYISNDGCVQYSFDLYNVL